MATFNERLKHLSFPDAELDSDVRQTFLKLRRSVGFLGLFLPVILISWGLSRNIDWSDMTSLSAFYWLPPPGTHALRRDWLVGSLAAIGICLIVYRGYGPLENWLLNLSGVAIILVALNPTAWPALHLDPHRFMLIAATIWFCAGATLSQAPPGSRARWERRYRLCAIAMAVAPLAAYVLARESQRIIWAEIAGVWVFSGYWFLKTREVSTVSMVEPRGGTFPRLRWANGVLERI